MLLKTRKLLDKSFSSLSIISIVLMSIFLLVLFLPIAFKGTQAFLFKGTIEFRKMDFENFNRGNEKDLKKEIKESNKIRMPVYKMLKEFKVELRSIHGERRRILRQEYKDLLKQTKILLGPPPGMPAPILIRNKYGQTRWDRAKIKLKNLMFNTTWDYSDTTKPGIKVFTPRILKFKGTKLEKLFPYVEKNIEKMMRPEFTFYPQFLTDKSIDTHFFGGIWAELLGTIYLTIGAMVFAVPFGVIAAIYFCEYATEGPVISFLRICISTLAGVPSIVFGLFGLAFFINTMHVSTSKSVLAGSLTLALLILPTIIRASEEAILSVPVTYKEAAFALGAGKWYTILTIILPVALPGILTGIIISMGRAAGETAPIIFTAAVSVGRPLSLGQVFSEPTPALSWNIYNLCTEHQAVDEIRHVQYAMVMALIGIVLILNITAIVLRAKVNKKMKV